MWDLVQQYPKHSHQRWPRSGLPLGNIIKMEHQPIPRILYKYKELNQYSKRILKNGELYFPSVNQLNDPFEGNIPFVMDPKTVTEENMKLKMREILKKRYPYYSDEEIEIEIDELFKDSESRKNMFNPAPPQGHTEQTRKKIEKSFGIFSLTANKNNFLMWSHYADSHSGLCFGFDTQKIYNSIIGKNIINNSICGTEYYNSSIGGFQKIIYQKYLPLFSVNEGLNTFIQKMLCTKSYIWKYENEYRLIKAQASQKIETIPLDAIVSVTLGCNMAVENKKLLMTQITKKNPGIHIFETRVSKSMFKLVIKRIY